MPQRHPLITIKLEKFHIWIFASTSLPENEIYDAPVQAMVGLIRNTKIFGLTRGHVIQQLHYARIIQEFRTGQWHRAPFAFEDTKNELELPDHIQLKLSLGNFSGRLNDLRAFVTFAKQFREAVYVQLG